MIGFVVISTHTLTWSVTPQGLVFLPHLYISTHTLTWSVTEAIRNLPGYGIISTHTLTWSVTSVKGNEHAHTLYFNSHAHVERDLLNLYFLARINISTHTLTWSVTLIAVVGMVAVEVFQLTRSRGA